MESSRDMERKVTMGLIHKGGRTPSSMSAEERVVQGVKNRAAIITANVGNDELTTVVNDKQF